MDILDEDEDGNTIKSEAFVVFKKERNMNI